MKRRGNFKCNVDNGHRPRVANVVRQGVRWLKNLSAAVVRALMPVGMGAAVIEWLKAFVHAPIPSDTDWPCALPGEPTKRVVLVERNIRHDAGAVLSASLRARGAI